MNRRFFLAAVPVGLAATLTGCAAYVRHGAKERTYGRRPLPAYLTSDTRWSLDPKHAKDLTFYTYERVSLPWVFYGSHGQ